jgi:hypothetical protein
MPVTLNSRIKRKKRIAKNTLGVGLYTSREVLAQLGAQDFGFGGDGWALVFEYPACYTAGEDGNG